MRVASCVFSVLKISTQKMRNFSSFLTLRTAITHSSSPYSLSPSSLQMFNFQFGPKYSQLYQQSSSTMSYAIHQLRSQHEAFSSTAPYAYQE